MIAKRVARILLGQSERQIADLIGRKVASAGFVVVQATVEGGVVSVEVKTDDEFSLSQLEKLRSTGLADDFKFWSPGLGKLWIEFPA